jgi:lipoate-protein ligase B
VGYPLLPLGKLNTENKLPEADYVGYVRKLEKTLITALMRLGVVAGQRSGLTGVWVQADVPAKIAAIGIKVDARGVSRHGFALNVNPDMEYWDGIIACGLSEPVVSLADLLDPVPEMDQVKKEVIIAFREVFE